ncbi:threonine/serine exporter family protein [Paenibacillus sp. MBLB4367]|uniref:threonine/serine exporter family protein n=1 Tax=Paenibacillus sp. MBLB4367 TaxID=3384767 RepID=UPI003907FDC8
MSQPINEDHDEIIQVCLLAGKIMLQNGGETYRVEDTMMRIAASFGIPLSHSFVTPTGILFAADGAAPRAMLTRISERSTDLRKVTLVNDISRKIGFGEMTAAEAFKQLQAVDRDRSAYPAWLKAAAAALASGCFLIMFKGVLGDVIPAIVAGGLGYLALDYLHRWVSIKFFAEFVASLIIGVISYLFVWNGLGQDLDKIITGSVMPLVPGLLITNAVRDLMAGHLVSGLSKGAEAFLTAFAIGAGIAFVLSFY